MLLETHRKRRRAGGAAYTVADLPRPPRRVSPAHNINTLPTATVPVLTPRGHHAIQDTQEENQEEPALSQVLTRTPSTASATPLRLVDRRVLLSRASRMQVLLLERLRCVNLRRARRAELLDEIIRLKKIMETLQRDIDATTRSLEQLEHLVQRLHTISFDGILSSERVPTTLESLPIPSRLAPGTILWTNPAFLSNDTDRISQAAKDDTHRPIPNATDSNSVGPTS